jgi:hypothetical protein
MSDYADPGRVPGALLDRLAMLNSMKTFSPGKVLLSVSTLWAAVGPYAFDWNETHIYNPEWPPHAKFHNAQTMSTGVALGVAGLYTTWMRRGRWTQGRLDVSTAAASIYWITQLSAVLYPETALFDHARQRTPAGTPAAPPRIRGPQPVVASVALAVNAVAYAMERRRLARRTA